MKLQPRHIVFAGGGSGGNFYPGIAVATALAAEYPEIRITFAGTGHSWERREAKSAGFRYQTIPCRPLARRFWQNFRFMADNAAGYFASRWLLREQHTSLVVGLGGFASAPTARAAIASGIPTVLLEQNVVPGRATKWLSPRATCVCTAFDQSGAHLSPDANIVVTGNPVRAAILAQGSSVVCRQNAKKRLLVLGGSVGARPMNRNVPWACYKLAPQLADWRIVHQTGNGDVDQTSRLYQKLGLDALVVSFIDNLPQVLAQTDLAVTRAGAVTLAELAVAGIPAVIVPFTDALGEHQMANALHYAEVGAGRLVDESAPGAPLSDRLITELGPLLTSGLERARCAAKMRTLATPDATRRVLSVISEILALPQKPLPCAA